MLNQTKKYSIVNNSRPIGFVTCYWVQRNMQWLDKNKRRQCRADAVCFDFVRRTAIGGIDLNHL